MGKRMDTVANYLIYVQNKLIVPILSMVIRLIVDFDSIEHIYPLLHL